METRRARSAPLQLVTRNLLALFAKAPRPGTVKTRLAPDFGAEAAAALYRAMLLDIADQHAGQAGCDLALWYAPDDAEGWFRAHVPEAYRLLPQTGPDLGARMRAFFAHHFDEGYTRIVLRGTDSPTLPQDRVNKALSALESDDLVICPDLDGGYNLVGLCGRDVTPCSS